MSEWRSLLLGDVLQFQRGFDLPKSQRVDGGVPIVSSSGVTGYHNEAKIHAPAVVIGRTGTLGSVFFLQEPCWPLNTSLWVKDFKGNDPRFVAALLETIDVTPANDKTSVPGVNRNDLHRFETRIPDLVTQKAIGAVIAALDSRTALCRDQAGMVEAIAVATFKSRYIDFDGVARFGDSELGSVPSGWAVEPLTQVADFVNGGAFTRGATGSGKMILRIADLNGGPSPSTKYGDFPVPRMQAAHTGDILFAWSGSLGVWIWPGPEAIVNQHIFNCFPRAGVPHWFLHQTLLRALPEFRSIASDKATTMGHIKRSHLAEVLVAIPPQEIIDELDPLMTSLYDRGLALRAQAANLEAIRDALLPKLVSGELEVSESLIEAYGAGEPVTAV